MIVILDELTPMEFFKHGGVVKITVGDTLTSECKTKKKLTIFDYKGYVRFFNGLYMSYLHNHPDYERRDVYGMVNTNIEITSSIGVSKYTIDLAYDNVNTYTEAKFYYSGEKIESPDVDKRDPYGIKNVCFSLMEETDTRWDEYAEQRLERGFDDSELWNLDFTLAKFLLPRLKRFRETTGGYPGNLKSKDEWYNILDQIIEGVELFVNDKTDDESEKKKINALELLKEWFCGLWW